jgi:hypothetical protein
VIGKDTAVLHASNIDFTSEATIGVFAVVPFLIEGSVLLIIKLKYAITDVQRVAYYDGEVYNVMCQGRSIPPVPLLNKGMKL